MDLNDPAELIRQGMEAEERLDPDQERLADLMSRVHTFAELAAIKTEAAQPLLGPFIRRKWRTIILGHTGEGKSTLASRMVGALVHGDKSFLGYQAVQSRVLFIDIEQDETMAQERIGEAVLRARYDGATIGEDMAKLDIAHLNRYARWTEGLALDDQSIDREAVRQAIELAKPDVVFLDPLYKAFLGNPNEAQLAALVMRFMDNLREQYGFALVVPMHPRKEQQGVQSRRLTKHDASGSAAWIWGAEMIVGIERYPGSQASLLFFKDRSNEIEPDTRWHLKYDRHNGFVRLRETHPDGPSTTEELVLDQLRRMVSDQQWYSAKDLAGFLDRPERTVKNALAELKKAKSRGRLPRLEVKGGDRGTHFYRWSPPMSVRDHVDDDRPLDFQLELGGDEE